MDEVTEKATLRCPRCRAEAVVTKVGWDPIRIECAHCGLVTTIQLGSGRFCPMCSELVQVEYDGKLIWECRRCNLAWREER